jgi:hypothetical protein
MNGKKMLRRAAAAASFAGALTVMGPADARADAKIVVSYDFINATHRNHYANVYRLSGANVVDVSLPDGAAYRLNLGQSVMRQDNGENYRASYHVEGGDIVITLDYPSHLVVTRIQSSGNSCTASRRYIRKPGGNFSGQAQGVSCEISS